MRIQKYFSEQKVLSRRETEAYISAGKIKVNGEVVRDLGRQIDPTKDTIEIVGGIPTKTTIVFNKPRGISSSKVRAEGKNIFNLLPQFEHLNTIGRLDKESEGLILLSNDGTLTNIITGKNDNPKNDIEKEYIVETQERMTQTKMNAMEQGMMLDDGPTLPAKAKLMSEHTFSIVLKEGRNHQVRRMADKVGLTVTKLKRVRIGTIKLSTLASGGFRLIKKEELEALKKA